MKTLDMADKYPPAESFEDDEPTIKMKVPPHFLHEGRRGPNWGLILSTLFCLAFWGVVAYLAFR